MTETTRTLHLMRTQMIIGMSPESRPNSMTTQLLKSNSLSRLLNNVTQTRNITCLVNLTSDPVHELCQLLLLLLPLLVILPFPSPSLDINIVAIAASGNKTPNWVQHCTTTGNDGRNILHSSPLHPPAPALPKKQQLMCYIFYYFFNLISTTNFEN